MRELLLMERRKSNVKKFANANPYIIQKRYIRYPGKINLNAKLHAILRTGEKI